MRDDVPSASPPWPVRWYRLEVRGPLPSALADELDGFIVRPGSTTTLTGPVVDASALYGLISRLESLGVALLSIQPTTPPSLAAGEPD
jgi:hypothetical protein